MIMVKQDYDRYPAFSLPSGFSFVKYDANLKNDWISIQTMTGNVPTPGAAEEILFSKLREESAEAGTHNYFEQLEKRMIFVLDENGKAAATACLWFGNHFERPWSKLHWVAVAPEYQGRGLAKAMVTKLFDMNMEIKLPLYLVSTTGSHKALVIYGIFGFRPYMGEMPSELATARL